jgi:hypothetical protein
MFIELVGGVCVIIGLFTRFVGAVLAIEMDNCAPVCASCERLRGRWRRLRICAAH